MTVSPPDSSITPDLFNDLSVYEGLIWGKVDIDTVKEEVLALTQELSLAVLAISSFLDIFQNNSSVTLSVTFKIVQGVCSCFSLFNFQGTSRAFFASASVS